MVANPVSLGASAGTNIETGAAVRRVNSWQTTYHMVRDVSTAETPNAAVTKQHVSQATDDDIGEVTI